MDAKLLTTSLFYKSLLWSFTGNINLFMLQTMPLLIVVFAQRHAAFFCLFLNTSIKRQNKQLKKRKGKSILPRETLK
jgi:hypothetical protein